MPEHHFKTNLLNFLNLFNFPFKEEDNYKIDYNEKKCKDTQKTKETKTKTINKGRKERNIHKKKRKDTDALKSFFLVKKSKTLNNIFYTKKLMFGKTLPSCHLTHHSL